MPAYAHTRTLDTDLAGAEARVRAAGWLIDRVERLDPLGVFRRIDAHKPRS